MRGRTQDSEQEKERKYIAANLLHVSSYQDWISYTPSIERIVGWTMHKMLPFCFSPINAYVEKDTKLSMHV